MKKQLIYMLSVFAFCAAVFTMPTVAFAEEVDTLSATDPNPPTLNSISIDHKTATVGDTVTISYDIEDTDGVVSVSVGTQRRGESGLSPWRGMSGDTTKRFSIDITSETQLGIYDITGISVRDAAGYVTNITTPNLEYTVVDPSEVPVYKVIEGANQTVDIASTSGFTIRFDGPLDEFYLLQMDGMTVSTDSYTLAEGSTIVTLKPEYLKTLSTGEHTLAAVAR